MTKSAIEREQCKARFIIAKREQTRDEVSRYGRKVCRPFGLYHTYTLMRYLDAGGNVKPNNQTKMRQITKRKCAK